VHRCASGQKKLLPGQNGTQSDSLGQQRTDSDNRGHSRQIATVRLDATKGLKRPQKQKREPETVGDKKLQLATVGNKKRQKATTGTLETTGDTRAARVEMARRVSEHKGMWRRFARFTY